MASLACGLAPTVQVLVTMRVLQGMGGALMIPGSLALITAFFDEADRGQAIGTWSGVTTAVEGYPVEPNKSYRFMGSVSIFDSAGFYEAGVANNGRKIMRFEIGNNK